MRILIAIVILIALGFLGAIGYLKSHERAFIYQPGERRVWPPARQFGLRERTVTYPSPHGATLSAWIVPAAEDKPSNVWVLICHGNYGNVGFGQRPEYSSARAFRRRVRARSGDWPAVDTDNRTRDCSSRKDERPG